MSNYLNISKADLEYAILEKTYKRIVSPNALPLRWFELKTEKQIEILKEAIKFRITILETKSYNATETVEESQEQAIQKI